MDTAQKLEEGLKQFSDDNFYKPRASPIVLETAKKVNDIVNKLFRSLNKLTNGLKSVLRNHAYQNSTRWLKYTKKIPVGRPILW